MAICSCSTLRSITRGSHSSGLLILQRYQQAHVRTVSIVMAYFNQQSQPNM